MREKRLNISKEQLAQFCEAYHVRRLSLYGSALRDDFKPDSNIDILIEFEPETAEPKKTLCLILTKRPRKRKIRKIKNIYQEINKS